MHVSGFNGGIAFAVSVSPYPWCLELRAACLAGCLSILLTFIIMSYNYGDLKQVTPLSDLGMIHKYLYPS